MQENKQKFSLVGNLGVSKSFSVRNQKEKLKCKKAKENISKLQIAAKS